MKEIREFAPTAEPGKAIEVQGVREITEQFALSYFSFSRRFQTEYLAAGDMTGHAPVMSSA